MTRINQLVDATTCHELLSFMDAYSGYNQIPIYAPNLDHTNLLQTEVYTVIQ